MPLCSKCSAEASFDKAVTLLPRLNGNTGVWSLVVEKQNANACAVYPFRILERQAPVSCCDKEYRRELDCTGSGYIS
jgi:hypothetical protein